MEMQVRKNSLNYLPVTQWSPNLTTESLVGPSTDRQLITAAAMAQRLK